jgi:hypothetical protein
MPSPVPASYWQVRASSLCVEKLSASPPPVLHQARLSKFFCIEKKRKREEEVEVKDEIEEYEDEDLDALEDYAARLERYSKMKRIAPELLTDGKKTDKTLWYLLIPERNRKHIFSPEIEKDEITVMKKMESIEARFIMHASHYISTHHQVDALELHNFNRDRKKIKLEEVEVSSQSTTTNYLFLSQDAPKF